MFKKLFKVKRIDINMRKIGEGKTKIIYENGDRYVVEFKNDMTAFDNIRKTSFEKKGTILADFKHNCMVIEWLKYM
ncbi:hypothetical protein DRN58_01115 [Thermococci archaeon]|nr:MAG: hypothetical protein DRN50_00935 [Thermococci archaeon]RLG01749.1 MAG: hypothetical protein DRN58_01115 [Thermococci archaeon]